MTNFAPIPSPAYSVKKDSGTKAPIAAASRRPTVSQTARSIGMVLNPCVSPDLTFWARVDCDGAGAEAQHEPAGSGVLPEQHEDTGSGFGAEQQDPAGVARASTDSTALVASSAFVIEREIAPGSVAGSGSGSDDSRRSVRSIRIPAISPVITATTGRVNA